MKGYTKTFTAILAAALFLGGAGLFISSIDDVLATPITPANNFQYVTEIIDGNEIVKIEKYTGSLIDVHIPSEINGLPVTIIMNHAFSMTDVRSVIIPDSVTFIDISAFFLSSALESVTLSNNITSIESNTFSGCSNLQSVNIPDSVTIIKTDAFKNCKTLTAVSIGGNLTEIGTAAFQGCSKLEEISLPSNFTRLNIGSFKDCKALIFADLGNVITSINSQAFYGCTALESIIIPDSVTSIGSYAFTDCPSLDTVYVRGNDMGYLSTYFAGKNVVQYVELEIPYIAPSKTAIKDANWTHIPVAISDVQVTIESGPSWIHINNNVLYGVPPATGDYIVTLKMSKDGYADRTETFVLSVVSELAFLNDPTNGAIFWAG